MLTSPSPFVLSAARQPGAAAPSRGSSGGPPSVIVVPTTARSTPALLESRTGSIRSPRQPFRGARVVVARTCLMFAGDCRLARPIRRSRAPRDLPARGILRRRAHNKKVRGRASELGAHLTFENGACGLRRAQSSPLTACTRPPPGKLPKPRRAGVELEFNGARRSPWTTRGHLVTQGYCSALPVAYSPHDSHLWSSFARLVLEASYEATLSAALINAANTGNRRVFLTLLGGGAFGNHEDWILSAVDRSLRIVRESDLAVGLVSYRESHPGVQRMVQSF